MEFTILKVIIPVLCGVILVVYGNIQPVFGETSDIVNILKDIRNELDNVKLINQRYGERIMILEKQVGECHMMYSELTRKESDEVRIVEQLADIELQMEADNQNTVERQDILETPPVSDHGRSNVVVGEINGDDELKVSVDSDQKTNEQELTETKERQSSASKRIIPVVGHNSIAFSAFLGMNSGLQGDPLGPSTHGGFQVPAGAILPFDNVETNEGQGFDPVRHVFTCPVSGIYYFSHSIVTDSRIITEIVKDGSLLAYVVSLGHVNQGSNAVVTLCNKGDEVFVRSSNDSRDSRLDLTMTMHACPSCDNDKIVSFTGYMISMPTYNRIAFTAFLGIHAAIQSNLPGEFQISADAILPFDNVETNEGQGFDPVTHVFTCPVSGVYYFSHSIVTESRIATELVKDGSVLANVLSWGHVNQGSNPVVTLCNKGDEVFVRLSKGIHENFIDLHHVMYECQSCDVDKIISFTGYLLSEN